MLASDIVIADAQATPVDHTFVPVGLDKTGVFWFSDQSNTNAVGYWRISVEQKQPSPAAAGTASGNGRSYRYRIGLHEPVLEVTGSSTVSGIPAAPTVAYVPRSFTEYIMPERCTTLDRKNLRKMTALLQSNAQMISLVEDLRLFN